MAEAVAPSTKLMIGGVEVHFPFKPYPSQLSLMSMIIKGLQNSKHCLLESPTGSGKTLALLCSSLAWQQDMRNKLGASHCQLNNEEDENACTGSDDADDKKVEVPKIWFGTRTHKQIAQITHELARTAYKSVNMTILSSREHSCIHPINMASKNKNDGCQELRKGTHEELLGGHCVYYQNVQRMKTHDHLRSCGLTSAWDLEDLVKLGNRIKACPYYSTRELINMSSIIFCPYNYLIDPSIRDQMSINLNNQIVILDEAHNVEDSARDAASFTVNETDIVNTLADIDHLIAECIKVDEHKCLHMLCTKVGQWMQENLTSLSESGFEVWSRIWVGSEFLEHFEEWGITADTLPLLSKSFRDATDTSESEEENPPVLHSASRALLGGLFQVLANLFVMSQMYAPDYRITLVRSSEFGVPPPRRTRDGWVAINKRPTKHYSVKLHFWCLNPAVSFGYLEHTRTVVLTSGTLSPMSSFSSELGIDFPIRLEAPHVIPDSQVWVGSIGCGPGGHQLQATYQNTNSYEFQDELGRLVGSVCEIIPNGVLCFVSSYKILEKLTERWKNTGVWDMISRRKDIFVEPHGRNKSSFDEILENFYVSVTPEPEFTITGALLLAVCRGKVSEGLDFSDNNARAVITVGIPFPNYKDTQVELKRKYNDMNSKAKGLLTGGDWYEIQAYRALNQALGRCIRHRNDWGALIIVDNRFCSNPKKYCKGLSKWVRQKVKKYTQFSIVSESLTSFCKTQKDREEGKIPVPDVSYTSFLTSVNSTSTQISVACPDVPSCSKSNEEVSPVRKALKYADRKNGLRIANDNNSNEGTVVIGTVETPKKANEIIIIPESPEILDNVVEDDDFKSIFSKSSAKRKSLSLVKSSKPTISEQLAKKCKMSINFDRRSEMSKDNDFKQKEDPDSPEQLNDPDSCEIIQQKVRRKRRTTKESNPTMSKQFKCKVCCECLTLVSGNVEKVPSTYTYITAHHPQFKNMYSITLSDAKLLGLQELKFGIGEVNLNSVWCDDDKRAYKFFQCVECEALVGFQPLHGDLTPEKILLFCNMVT